MNESSQEARARRIIERLKMFNRKERDHLMKFALCENPEAPQISTDLWRQIRETKGRNKPRPEKIFLGVDYHLNWLYAAIATAQFSNNELDQPFPNIWDYGSQQSSGTSVPLEGNQQDVDLLVAWIDAKNGVQVVLVEAKLDSSWNDKQISDKLDRLKKIRSDALKAEVCPITWQFLLMSPQELPPNITPKALEIEKKHRWALKESRGSDNPEFWHMRLPRAPGGATVKRVSGDWGHWKVLQGKCD